MAPNINDENAPTRHNVVYLAVALLVFDATMWLFALIAWEHGLFRTTLLIGIGFSLLAIGIWPLRPRSGPRLGKATRGMIIAAASCLALLVTSVMAHTLYHTAKTGVILLDEGQNTYRAARGLLKGENPYGRGALFDIVTYVERSKYRVEAGVGPHLPASQVAAVLIKYWQTLDPRLKRELLPLSDGGSAGERENSLLGYKYGPVILLMTAALVPAFGPLAVPLGNILATAILFTAVWLILRTVGADRITAIMALCAIMLDYHIVDYYIIYSASDVWPLMFGFLGVASAMLGHRLVPALLVGLAIGCKVFPGLLFLPVLFLKPSWGALTVLFTTLITLMLPWMIADAHGFLLNVMLWGSLMDADMTSWVYYAPEQIVLPMKIAVGCLTAITMWCTVRAIQRGTTWFWMMAIIAISTILLGNVFHNNYLPWVTIWGVLAIVQWAHLYATSNSRSCSDGDKYPHEGPTLQVCFDGILTQVPQAVIPGNT
jgi:hypothetical protein